MCELCVSVSISRLDGRAVELLLRDVAIMLAHELHKLFVHAQQGKLLELFAFKQRIALGENVPGGAQQTP